ncbi:PepSY domain-containing protein [Shewanella sp. 1180_01]|uniref:PepSY domain-containing protein n=1 Tax=Shewanella sp. 1180_01 TaxID=2604451 RepID=UPI004063A3EE
MKIPLIFLALAVGMISSCNAHDDDLSNKVVEWVKEGKVLPFDTIMQRYESRLKGRLLDLEVEQKHGRIIYELEILRDDGIVYEIKIDAKTGEWLKEKVD